MKQLTDEQRELLQTSIDFLKRDIWNNYNDAGTIRTLVIGNVNHIESYIAKLASSEQAAREEIKRLQEQLKGIGVEEYLTLQRKHFETREQLNKAAEVLQWYADVSNYRQPKPFYMPFIEVDLGGRAHKFLSSLSQEGENP